ncbi:hypothetical protein BBK36DRAFT_1165614 [Trichoderma citrinoviride]|uniref:Uncharacterized protein n=1 Tax=Trichoderma citrinoviride TaxID=58853 RepID=A0A2T4BJ37_9HYPO|nr:hypothetical protein BBK36DRAFT_1165614 [Trichoderma citrinoviride]PTB69334.1 hypothetical protein BBK36DRAFT_1165614 [Trichoderma citrinoviride]
MSDNRIARGNTPSGALDHVLQPDTPRSEMESRLWIVDRILEPQTLPHFLESTMFGTLPDGSRSSFPPLSEEIVMLIQQPLAAWAPPPFDASHEIPMQQIAMRVGSHEDADRLVPITKELHAMKSRVWEGIMPLSERRWEELGLSSPDRFHEACQYLCAVTNTFHYLNLPPIKHALRETYNLIWGHLKDFEDAVNAKNRLEGQPEVQIAARWHDYIKAHYKFISERSHRWVTDSIDRLRGPILEELANVSSTPEFSSQQWMLTDKLHDLLENGAQADSGIFLPMDGYEGSGLAAQDDAPPRPDAAEPYRKEPISFSANTHARKGDYYLRLKYLSRTEVWLGQERGGMDVPPGLPTGFEVLSDTARTAQCQVRAQEQARRELRGEPVALEQELWVTKANEYLGTETNFEWGYVAYRLSHEHTDEEWEAFKGKFEEDVQDWGRGLKGAEVIRERSKVYWRDARDLGVADGDVDALRTHFQAIRESEDFPSGVHTDIVLAADKGVIDSYLQPTPQQKGFVMAIDAYYDPNEVDGDRAAESPGYTGVVRVLGSLLWDDLGPLVFMQTQHLFELWPLAMRHPLGVYEGPLGRI